MGRVTRGPRKLSGTRLKEASEKVLSFEKDTRLQGYLQHATEIASAPSRRCQPSAFSYVGYGTIAPSD